MKTVTTIISATRLSLYANAALPAPRTPITPIAVIPRCMNSFSAL